MKTKWRTWWIYDYEDNLFVERTNTGLQNSIEVIDTGAVRQLQIELKEEKQYRKIASQYHDDFEHILEQNEQLRAERNEYLSRLHEKSEEVLALLEDKKRLRKALEEILNEVGTSTLTNKIATKALCE